ncbi:hypothetical protein IWQ57_007007, partial [Coemansia nantahalensis]
RVCRDVLVGDHAPARRICAGGRAEQARRCAHDGVVAALQGGHQPARRAAGKHARCDVCQYVDLERGRAGAVLLADPAHPAHAACQQHIRPVSDHGHRAGVQRRRHGVAHLVAAKHHCHRHHAPGAVVARVVCRVSARVPRLRRRHLAAAARRLPPDALDAAHPPGALHQRAPEPPPDLRVRCGCRHHPAVVLRVEPGLGLWRHGHRGHHPAGAAVWLPQGAEQGGFQQLSVDRRRARHGRRRAGPRRGLERTAARAGRPDRGAGRRPAAVWRAVRVLRPGPGRLHLHLAHRRRPHHPAHCRRGRRPLARPPQPPARHGRRADGLGRHG